MVCNGGVFMFTLMDWHTASWAILLLGMAEVGQTAIYFVSPIKLFKTLLLLHNYYEPNHFVTIFCFCCLIVINERAHKYSFIILHDFPFIFK